MCAATVFMTTLYSYDIAKLLPKIEVAVPPFRWLAISSVFMSLFVAACFERFAKLMACAMEAVAISRRHSRDYRFQPLVFRKQSDLRGMKNRALFIPS